MAVREIRKAFELYIYPPSSEAIVVEVKHLPTTIQPEQTNLEPNGHKLFEKKDCHHLTQLAWAQWQ